MESPKFLASVACTMPQRYKLPSPLQCWKREKKLNKNVTAPQNNKVF